jgi:pyruvate/2-oxoglutarate/acetoin dehydrogenase E1 component
MKKHLISYSGAINEALDQSMKIDPNVYVIGQLVDYQPGVFGTTSGLVKKYGAKRVQDFPVAESLMTSMSIGMCLNQINKVVLVHHRIDFMLYSMDAIVNWMSLWKFKSYKDTSLSITIRAIVGKGWGQGPQHSKSFHSWFANLPGVRVAIPSCPYDAKGFLIESIFSKIPTIIIEHRSLFEDKQLIPINPYRLEFGKANVVRKGDDLCIISIGYLTKFAINISDYYRKSSKITIEVIDVRTLSPIDKKTLIKSFLKIKKVIILDPSWKSYGASAEIVAILHKSIKNKKKYFIERISYPDSHTPMSPKLESKFYISEKKIIKKIEELLHI